MPMHDWTKVDAQIYHAFHAFWISELSRTLNGGLLPDEYYSLIEITFPSLSLETHFAATTEPEVCLHVQSSIAVKDVRDDRTVAMIEIISPGNRSNRLGIRALSDKTEELIERRIHSLINDPFQLPVNEPLTLVAYESDLITLASIETVAVGRSLPDMPLFLQPNGCVMVPLEATYNAAFEAMPRRWRKVLENIGTAPQS